MEAGKGSRSERQARRYRQHRSSPETATESSDLNEALQLLRRRRQAGKTLDVKTYSMIIEACGTSKRLEEARNVFEMMKADGTRPDRVAYTLMIGISRGQRARDLFDEMVADGFQPDEIAYSLMASCYRQTGDWPKIIELLETACQQGIQLDEQVYQDLMYAAKRSQRWAEAIQVFESFQDTGLKVKPSLHCLAIEAAQRKTDWRKALSLLADLQEHNLPLKGHAVEWAAAACAEGAAWEQATELFNMRQQLRSPLSQTSCESILGAHQSAGKWQASLELLEKMEHEGLMPRGHMQPPVSQRRGMHMGKTFQMTDIEPARHIWDPSGHAYQYQPMPRMAPAAATTLQAEASNWQLPQFQVVPHEVPRSPQAADANYQVYSYMREASQQVEQRPQRECGRTWHHPQHMLQAQGVPHGIQAWESHQRPQCVLVSAPLVYWANYQHELLMPEAAQGVEYSNQARDGTHSHLPSGSATRNNDTEANSASASK